MNLNIARCAITYVLTNYSHVMVLMWFQKKNCRMGSSSHWTLHWYWTIWHPYDSLQAQKSPYSWRAFIYHHGIPSILHACRLPSVIHQCQQLPLCWCAKLHGTHPHHTPSDCYEDSDGWWERARKKKKEPNMLYARAFSRHYDKDRSFLISHRFFCFIWRE